MIYKQLLFISVILLIITFAFAVFLVSKCYTYYKKSLALRLDPTEILFAAHKDDFADCHFKHKIMIIGSSRASHWSSFPIKNSCLINLGINGQTSTQVSMRASAQLQKFKPDIVILQVGTNDIKAISLFPEKKEFIFKRYKENIKEIVNSCNVLNSKIIITTIFPIPKVPLYRKFIWSNQSTNAINEFNSFLSGLADDENVYVFDSYKLLKDVDSEYLNSRFKKDFLHINESGYDHLNNELTTLIESITTNQLQ